MTVSATDADDTVGTKARPPPPSVHLRGSTDVARESTSACNAAAGAAPHALSVAGVVATFSTHLLHGLSEHHVQHLRAAHGHNVLAEARPPSWWVVLARQFVDVGIGVLVVAAVISAFAGEWVDAAVIVAIVLLNGFLGFIQEERAGRALAALKKLSAPQARVIRSGELRVIPASELVPGDRVELEAGDHVPADVRLTHTAGFRVHEAALTGESEPVDKDHDAVHAANTPLADRTNVAHMGTVATGGSASGIVVATGMATELGRIAGLLGRHEPEPTPLQRRLARLGRSLVIACLALVVVIAGLQLSRGGELGAVFMTAVSLAVAGVPEGLPAVVTIALALGLQRMARRNALIRRLPSVETLGSVTVICSDKTGTLTRNQMTVCEVHAGDRRFDVTGSGYLPEGQFLRESQAVAPRDEPDLTTALTIGAVCNHARVVDRGGGDWQVIGDPTEGALVVAAMKAGIRTLAADVRPVREVPFDSDRKMMTLVVHAPQTGVATTYTKGAPEVVLNQCATERCGGTSIPLRPDRHRDILFDSADMAARALRVLAVAYREDPPASHASDPVGDEAALTFSGLIGMRDPPRDEAREAVRTCHEAGIRPVMITGDHPATAAAIADDVGFNRIGGDGVLTCRDLDRMTDQALAAAADATSVYARVTAEHKLRIVRALRSRGHVVAMTGDGVNDAPAIEEADIGIAMGRTGTDVTREASDMVLTDDNFASIVAAVEEGRGIFDNLRKFAHYLLASNASELLFVLTAALVGWPLPLAAVQILWINLITDSLPALALGVEPPERDAMRRPPRPVDEPVIGARQGMLILAHGLLIAAAAAVGFAATYGGDPGRLGEARTAAFCVLAFAQLLYALACRSLTVPLLRLGLGTNPHLLAALLGGVLLQLGAVLLPPVRPLLKTTPLPGWEAWVLVTVLAVLPMASIEVAKWIRKRLVAK